MARAQPSGRSSAERPDRAVRAAPDRSVPASTASPATSPSGAGPSTGSASTATSTASSTCPSTTCSRMRAIGITRDFQCVTGWRVADVKWTRRPASRRPRRRPACSATPTPSGSRRSTARTRESLTLAQARRDDVLVAYELEGEELSSAHGGPARLYVAPMYGYKSLKWSAVDRAHRAMSSRATGKSGATTSTDGSGGRTAGTTRPYDRDAPDPRPRSTPIADGDLERFDTIERDGALGDGVAVRRPDAHRRRALRRPDQHPGRSARPRPQHPRDRRARAADPGPGRARRALGPSAAATTSAGSAAGSATTARGSGAAPATTRSSASSTRARSSTRSSSAPRPC